jgi:SPP1 gp7 family putative phage head morphogenesis protein
MTDWLMRSEPPSDPVERAQWRLEVEEEFAAKVRAALVKIIVGSYEQFLSTLTAAGDLSALDAIPQQWNVFIAETLIPDLDEVYKSGALMAWNVAPTTADLPMSAGQGWSQIIATDAMDYQAEAANRLSQVGNDVWLKVNSQVTDSLAQGASTEDLKNQIEQVTQFSEFRADTIARTEMNSAFVNGAYQGEAALGEYGPRFKEWLAVGDARTRPEHMDANGTVVPFDDPFIVGGESMSHPMDSSGSAENVVNCRCDVLFYYVGDTLPDGTLIEGASTLSANVEVEDFAPTPQELEAQRKREERQRRQKEYYAETKVTQQTAERAADRWNVKPDEIISYRQDALAMRAEIKASAARTQYDLYGMLDRTGGRITMPRGKLGGEWDSLERVSSAERARLMKWMDRKPGGTTIDELADAAREAGFISRNAGADEALEWYREITRQIDATTAIRLGKQPSRRLYGDLDLNALAPVDYTDVSKIIGVHTDDAAGYLAQVNRELYSEQAYSALGDAVLSADPPWRMPFQRWADEVLDNDYLLRTTATDEAWQRARVLIPDQFDVADASLEDIYASIISAARTAGLEVSDNAVIPWA